MSLRALITGAVATAFRAAGDVPESGILYLDPVHTHDATNDVQTTVWGQELAINYVILYAADMNVEIVAADIGPVTERRRAILQGAEITAGTIDHRSELEVAGMTWKVHAVQPDPVGATYVLHLWR